MPVRMPLLDVMLEHNLLAEKVLRQFLPCGFGKVLCRFNVNQHA